ncbi:MAG TPA: hypothetical protein VK186_01450 [Candidatus Deferrimicrobium sp.]|nr:hypothetical protein [Candidatus Deferrimicrobium sp.]
MSSWFWDKKWACGEDVAKLSDSFGKAYCESHKILNFSDVYRSKD